MAKFNEYTQKATPEDNDTLMIYDDAAKANKLSPFSGIWNWIVGKLTNAVISNLQTSDKTVLGAINELNSNSLTHAERITINPSDGKSIILDDESSYLICYSTINSANIVGMGFAVALSRMSEEKTGGILSVNPEISGINFTLDGNTLKVSTNTWIVMTLTKI